MPIPTFDELYNRVKALERRTFADKINTATGHVQGGAKFSHQGTLSAGQIAYDTGTGFWIEYNGGTPRLSIGNSAGNKMLWDGTNVSIVGGITATTGHIGGWTINATTLTGGNVTLDSAGLLKINYTAGATGLQLDNNGNAEFNNILARGAIRSAVFEYQRLQATAGSILVAKSADVLDADMTAADASTLTISGKVTFAVNDVLRIREGANDEWLLVTNIGSAPVYTVTRDQAAAFAANTNPAWKKGAAVVNYGPSGQGFLYLTADDADGPFYSVRTHAGSPWSTTTERARLGNLRNAFGVGANNRYGFGAGDFAGGNYLMYNPTDGFVLKAGAGNVLIDANGLTIVGNTSAAYGATHAVNITDGAGHIIDYLAGAYASSTGYLFLTSDTSALGANQSNVIQINSVGSGAGVRDASLRADGTYGFEVNYDGTTATTSLKGHDNVSIGPLRTLRGPFSNASLTVVDGLNVGTATSAATGQVRASADIYPGGTNTRILSYENGSVAAAGTWTVRALGSNTAAFVIVAEAEGGSGNRRVMLAIYSAGVVTLVSNPDAAWAITSTAGKLCLYLSAGNLLFENRLAGASAGQNIMILGR